MANKMRLRIVTPTRKMYDDDVEMVIMRGKEGDFGILPGHAPLTAAISYGVIQIKTDDEELHAAVIGGFVEVQGDSVTVLTDAAEWPDEIDVERAQKAKERAEKRLEEAAGSTVDIRRAELALRRSLVRIEVSSYSLIKGNRGHN